MGLLTRIKNSEMNYEGLNCNGTSFYISGLVPMEFFIHPRESSKYIKPLEQIDYPELGSLVVWRLADWVSHSGVVIDTNPLKIIHRPKTGKRTTTNHLDEIMYSYGPCNLEFYRPKLALRNIFYSLVDYCKRQISVKS